MLRPSRRRGRPPKGGTLVKGQRLVSIFALNRHKKDEVSLRLKWDGFRSELVGYARLIQ